MTQIIENASLATRPLGGEHTCAVSDLARELSQRCDSLEAKVRRERQAAVNARVVMAIHERVPAAETTQKQIQATLEYVKEHFGSTFAVQLAKSEK